MKKIIFAILVVCFTLSVEQTQVFAEDMTLYYTDEFSINDFNQMDLRKIDTLTLYNFDISLVPWIQLSTLKNLYLYDCINSEELTIKDNVLRVLEVSYSPDFIGEKINYKCFAKQKKLVELTYVNADLETINLSHNKDLRRVDCSQNPLTKFSIDNDNLSLLNVRNCQLADVKLKAKNLISFDCSGNKLRKLDISRCKRIENLCCSSNEITKLDLSDSKNLKVFSCSDCPINKIDLRQQKKCTIIDISNCKIKKVLFPKRLVNLEYFIINNNKLSKVDLSMTKLGKRLIFRGDGIRCKARNTTKVIKIKANQSDIVDRLFDDYF